MSTDVINERVTVVSYPVAETKIAEWREQFMPLELDDINDTKTLALIHQSRITVKNARIEIERRRKLLKEDSLRYGREVDAVAKHLTSQLVPIESHLEEQENKVAREKERIRLAQVEDQRVKTQARVDALAAVSCILPFAECEQMNEQQFTDRLASETARHESELAAAAERARLQALEDARLKAEAEKLAAERAALERERMAQQAEAERIAAEKRKLEEAEAAQRRAAELEAAKAAAAERARIETEQRIEREKAAAKAKSEAEEAERVRLAALAPDCDKLNALADAIEAISIPSVSRDARIALAACEKAIDAAVATIRKSAQSLATGK